jgi:hypothetical protein
MVWQTANRRAGALTPWEHPMRVNVPEVDLIRAFAEKGGQLRPQLVEAVGLRTSFKWL